MTAMTDCLQPACAAAVSERKSSGASSHTLGASLKRQSALPGCRKHLGAVLLATTWLRDIACQRTEQCLPQRLICSPCRLAILSDPAGSWGLTSSSLKSMTCIAAGAGWQTGRPSERPLRAEPAQRGLFITQLVESSRLHSAIGAAKQTPGLFAGDTCLVDPVMPLARLFCPRQSFKDAKGMSWCTLS